MKAKLLIGQLNVFYDLGDLRRTFVAGSGGALAPSSGAAG